MNDFMLVSVSVFFALAPILLSLLVRQSVKKSRQRIIADLAKFFRIDEEDAKNRPREDKTDLLHSFEFVKFKYYVEKVVESKSPSAETSQATRSEDLESKHDECAGNSGSKHSKEEAGADFMADEWTLAALPLVILLVLANVVAVIILIVSFKIRGTDSSIPTCVFDFFEGHRAYRYALLAAYLGVYAYMIRAFFQAINNFDLTPSSFFGAFNNLIFGMAIPQVVFFFFTSKDTNGALTIAALVMTFFVGGYMPDAVLRWVLQRSAIRYFKEERFDYGERGKSTPVEVLDGIDSLIRFRLSDFHLTTVQNLACANPIMLFVETPYGIYQMIDWVAQAQLCASVGPDRLFKLWDLGIRTIFDLERVALHKEFHDDTLLWAIENALFGVDKGRLGVAEPKNALLGKPDNWSPDPVIKNITARIDGPYTHRLRQIVIRVADQLGGAGTRFLPSIISPPM